MAAKKRPATKRQGAAKKTAAKKPVPRTWRGKSYTAPKKKANRFKGAGKKGSGKRMIYRSGGSKNVLTAWRSLGQARRNRLKRVARRNPGKLGLTQLIRQRVIKPRKQAGLQGTTGESWGSKQTQAPTQAPVVPQGSPGLTVPQKRKIPSRMRGWTP